MSTLSYSAIIRHPDYFSITGQVAECARQKMPEAGLRLSKAVSIVLSGGVQPSALVQGGWRVASQSGGEGYEVNGDSCTCADYVRHAAETPGVICKHIIASWLYRRVVQRLDTPDYESLPPDAGCWVPIDQDGTPCCASGGTCAHQTSGIPPQFITELHGKRFVQYAGLLALAHERGLVELSAEITVYVPEVIAIAKATAVFADGRRFSESADATPGNVNARVKPHFVRMSLTRAKARALRDALNIGLVALEELGE